MQYDFGNLESPLSGTVFINTHLEPWRNALHSSHSGTSRPSYATAGMVWLDTTTTPWNWKMYDGADDISLGTINASTNAFVPGGVLLNNLNASTNPTAGDDTADSYSVGSLWINTTADVIYICVDATLGAAVWRLLIDSVSTQTMSAKTLTNPTINAGGGTIILPQGTSPSQIAEGEIFWDTDDDLLTVGTSAGRKVMCDTNGSQTLLNKAIGSGCTAVTQSPGDNSTKVATTAYVDSAAAIITPWVAYTPTFTGFGTPSNVSFFSRRVGDTLQIRGKFQTGSSTATEGRVTMGYNGTNNNVTSDSTKVPSIQLCGMGTYNVSSAAQMTVLIEQSVGYLTFGLSGGSNAGLSKLNANSLIASPNSLSFFAEIPISGW